MFKMSKKVKALEMEFNNFFIKKCKTGVDFVKVTLTHPVNNGTILLLSELISSYQCTIDIKRSGKGLTVIAKV